MKRMFVRILFLVMVGFLFTPSLEGQEFASKKVSASRNNSASTPMFDLFNIVNANTILGVETLASTTRDRHGQTVPRFGRVTQILNPRIFRLGVRWIF